MASPLFSAHTRTLHVQLNGAETANTVRSLKREKCCMFEDQTLQQKHSNPRADGMFAGTESARLIG